ncbi:MAG TPA: assimilatory sulfite reductase (NADPH) hemoprotein subunit [Gammaproteobacteria bacterium]|nr:assimilatory sulfite reductase (NADPH) hemoprotein subunit [Gammaproteobacteria bacterium]
MASEDDRSRALGRPLDELHPNERIKAGSDYLRGTIAEGLADRISGSISESDNQLTKFHGIYQQDDRELRSERRRQKLEPAYQFMVRVRLPGGVCTPEQWLTLDELARTRANGSLRLTTRQTFQFHGVLKHDLKGTIRGLHEALLDTLAACGDDNRGVMCSVNPHLSSLHAAVHPLAKRVSDHLLPRTGAYHEIWLDRERAIDTREEEEPLYGRTYLPRKFKIGFALPPANDIDVYSQDLGFIGIEEHGALAGFDVCVGGGMGRTDNEPATYPRLADVIGFCRPDRVVQLAETVVTIQRDYGDRVDRKRARMKYTIDDRGLDWFRAELERRLGWSLEPARDYAFEHNGDRYGWVEGEDGRWHCTLFIENGRVRDREDCQLMTGLREIARVHEGEFRVTGNQNLIIAGVKRGQRRRIEKLMAGYGLEDPAHHSAVRRSAMACVALPTCGLAMAESERYLPDLLTRIEGIMEQAGIPEQPIVIRMTGCPNGCARPYLAEIGFSGRAPGKYNMYLGGGFHGQRLNRPYLDNVGEETILETLGPMIHRYARERREGEPFGDFVIRAGYVAEVKAGREFNDPA